MSETSENLFAVGETVIFKSGGRSYLKKVEKITKTGRIKLDNGDYFKSNGSFIGGSMYYYPHIYKATQEEINSITRDDFIRHVISKMRNVKTITYEEAVEIEKVLNPGTVNEVKI